MVIILRIFSVFACLSMSVVFVLSVLGLMRENPQVEQMLQQPNIVERFEETCDKQDNPAEKSSLLVVQAQAFASYLNPPPPGEKKQTQLFAAEQTPSRNTPEIPPPPVPTAKFKVLGTSYYPNQPERSMALIWQPGSQEGYERWVKEGSRLGHFVVYKIKRGVVVYRDNQERTGFYSGNYGRWFGEHRSVGTDTLRVKRPELHAWITSTSWSKMDATNLKEMHGNIYTAKVNAITPWACIQRPEKWIGGDPNPGTAFRVFEGPRFAGSQDGTCKVMRGYYYYKQLSRAGQPGIAVAKAFAMDSEVAIIAFSANGSKNPDTFMLINMGKQDKQIALRVSGSSGKVFNVFRTTDDKDRYNQIGRFKLDNGTIQYKSPARSATTFFTR